MVASFTGLVGVGATGFSGATFAGCFRAAGASTFAAGFAAFVAGFAGVAPTAPRSKAASAAVSLRGVCRDMPSLPGSGWMP